MLSLTSSVSSAGIVMSASLTTFMPSCSPSAFKTWSSLTSPMRTATLPSSSDAGPLLLLEHLPEGFLVEVTHVDHDRAESSCHWSDVRGQSAVVRVESPSGQTAIESGCDGESIDEYLDETTWDGRRPVDSDSVVDA